MVIHTAIAKVNHIDSQLITVMHCPKLCLLSIEHDLPVVSNIPS